MPQSMIYAMKQLGMPGRDGRAAKEWKGSEWGGEKDGW